MSHFPFHIMVKPAGALCNLDCEYCFYLEKEPLYPEKRERAMQAGMLEQYIRSHIEAEPSDSVTFAWQGGEPTVLGVGAFERIIELQLRYAAGKKIQNTLQTNGTLLDDRWGEFLSQNQILVGLSIDGPRELHDYYRRDKGGRGTFDQVIRGLDILHKHAIEFNTLTVVNSHNSAYPIEIYSFLKQIGSRFMQFIPVVERRAARPTDNGLVLIQPAFEEEAAVTEWSVVPLTFGHFLCRIFDEWVKRDVGSYYIQHFDVALESWLVIPQSLCVFRRTCGSALALEHSGDLYSCDHFVYPENRLGNIADQPLLGLVRSAQQEEFGRAKLKTLPRMCRECSVRFACNGGCPKHRFAVTPEGESGLNYLCAGYKCFFEHIDPYMRFMTAELRAGRAPANIMRVVDS